MPVEMFTPSLPGGYGFGWFVESGTRAKQYHASLDPGLAAIEIRYPDDQVFVIVLANVEDAPGAYHRQRLGRARGRRTADLK
jgi:hypothetical protein